MGHTYIETSFVFSGRTQAAPLPPLKDIAFHPLEVDLGCPRTSGLTTPFFLVPVITKFVHALLWGARALRFRWEMVVAKG